MARFLAILTRIEETLLVAVFCAMVALFSGGVLAREVSDDLSRRLAWIDEATRYLMIWLVFLALGLALQRGRHVAMDAYLRRMSAPARARIGRLIDASGLAFSLYLVWFGLEITWLVLGTGQRSPTLGVTTATLYLAMPVGFLLLAIRFAASLFGAIDRHGPETEAVP